MNLLRRPKSSSLALKAGPFFYWVGPGGIEAVKSNKNPLLDWFHGIGDSDDGTFSRTDRGYAKAYQASAWVFRCVKIRAQVLADIPLRVMVKDKELSKHPLSKALADVQLLKDTESDLLIFGRAFWSFGRYPDGSAWLRRLNASTIEVDADEDGINQFRQMIDGRKIRDYKSAELVYFRDYNPDDDLGSVSPVSLALTAVGVTENISAFAEYFFRNGAMPQGILVSETRMQDTDKERVLADWKRNFQGMENAHGTALLDGGKITYEPITPPLVDLAMTELREEERREIAAALFVPPVMAGITDAANYATAQEQRKSLYTEAVIPELKSMCSTVNRQLVPYYGVRQAKVEPNIDDIEVLQEDRVEITQRAAMAFPAGVMSLNAALRLQNLEPIKDGTGKERDYFFFAGKLIPRSALETGDLSAFETPAPTLPFMSLPQPPVQSALPVPIEQRALPAPMVLDNPPQKAVVDIVVHAPSPESAAERKQTVIRDTALEDLRRWEKKVAKKGAFTPFDPDYLPPAFTAFVRMDVQAWDGETDRAAWIKAAFERAESWLKADDELATPEEFERFWSGIDGLFAQVAAAFDASWEALPARLAGALRQTGTAGAEMDLSAFEKAAEEDLLARLVGSETEPGPLVAVFLAGAARGDELLREMKSAKQSGAGIAWDVIDQLARAWAKQHSAEMVRGINDTTLKVFRSKISEWVSKGGSLEDLARYIEGDLTGLAIPPDWSPGKVQWATSRERARLIAQTETTAAFHEGSVQRWEQAGVKRGIWRTQRDIHVDDEICRPLNKIEGDLRGGWVHPKTGHIYRPPAHPGCRCFIQPLAETSSQRQPLPEPLPLDIGAYENRHALDFARQATPDKLDAGSCDNPQCQQAYLYFAYNETGDPTFSRERVNAAKSEVLYGVYTLGRGNVNQQIIERARQQAAGVLAADEWLLGQVLTNQERTLLKKLAASSDDQVLKQIDKLRDKRLRGSIAELSEAQAARGKRYDPFVSAAEADGAARLREYQTGVA